MGEGTLSRVQIKITLAIIASYSLCFKATAAFFEINVINKTVSHFKGELYYARYENMVSYSLFSFLDIQL